MKNSGYSTQYRIQILDSAEKAFEKMIEDDKNGVKPLFRSRDWNKDERNQQKERKKLDWYKNGGVIEDGTERGKIEYKTVLFVPVTKGGGLGKELRKREEEINKYSKERIKIIEDGGVQMKDFLVKKDPFPNLKCGRKNCLICNSEVAETLKIPCNSNNIGYRLNCDTCIERGQTKVYEGESSRAARVRGTEHLRDLKNEKMDSALFKHKENEHKSEEMKISMEITKKFKDPLTRQANEAVRINNRGKSELLNSKSEFNHPPTARISVERRTKFYPKIVPELKLSCPRKQPNLTIGPSM